MAIYRYKRSVLVDFIIERPFFPSDWTRADLAFLRIGRVPAMIGYCRPWSHCHTPACPSGGGFASVATEATPVETCHRHVSKPAFESIPPDTKKKNRYSNEYRFFCGRWWIRTTEVIDDRFTVCSLWPLGKPSIFDYQLDWSWWTDLNPRPADYKSAALPTELHQRFVKPSVSATYI